MAKPPSGEEIALLAVLSSNESPKEDTRIVRAVAWEKLKAENDFAEKLVSRIKDFEVKWRASGIPNHYDSERSHLIRAMGGLPDVRIVAKLGEFFSDMEWTEDPVEHAMSGADWGLTSPNGMLAAQSLARLIEKPPVQKDPDSYLEGDVEPWKLWFEQVKAGTRTFRFKGDPQEYSLAGPVSEARSPLGDPISGSRPGALPDPGASILPQENQTPLPVLPLVAASLLLAVALWYSTRRGKGKA